MKYKIMKNYYAPMCDDWDILNAPEPAHAIMYRRCNFDCAFCMNRFHNDDDYVDMDYDQFVYIVNELIKSGNRFKFSGGEPTMNPDLPRDMRAVKELGGYVFLDTNASNTKMIAELVNDKLVDVLGISLKGLCKEQAMEVSGVKKGALCWDNVLESIRVSAENPDVRVIITYVFYNEATVAEIEQYARVIAPFPNVYLKINNLLYNKHHQDNLSPIKQDAFLETANAFLDKNEEWKGKMIVVNSFRAISEYEAIVFL